MIPDVRFEADFLRTALLLGVVRTADVREWADALLAADAEPVALLADVALAQLELTTLREALRPLTIPSDAPTLGPALLAFLATDSAASALSIADRLRILGQLRRENVLATPIADTIKAFEDRWMLASAGIGIDSSVAADLNQWLASARGAAYYRVSVADVDERAALLAALSRKVVRNRRAMPSARTGSQAWIVPSSDTRVVLVLNEKLWNIAVAEFSPLPPASRIPYAVLPPSAVLVLDEATVEPMGLREAATRLAEQPGR